MNRSLGEVHGEKIWEEGDSLATMTREVYWNGMETTTSMATIRTSSVVPDIILLHVSRFS
jgi:hypothetical protein